MTAAASRACRPRHRTAVLAVLALLAAGCAGPAPAGDATSVRPPGFVRSDGTRLLLDGRPYVFTGINIYNAADPSGLCSYAMARGRVLPDALAAIGPGKEVFRAWFFQAQATTAGRRDWSNLDRTLAVARSHGQKVIAVLADQWGHCEGGAPAASAYRDEDWYRSGYRTRPTGPHQPASYRQWVTEVVTRYRADPTVLAWQLVNEAEDARSRDGTCAPTAAGTLTAFTVDMAGLVKGIDPDHLLSLGTIGSGQCGARNEEYQAVHAVPGIDLCEYHDYHLPRQAVPGDRWNGLAVRLRQCQALAKPLFVGEIGLNPTETGGGLGGRARALENKVAGQLRAGAVGVLVWAWRDGSHGGSSPNDYYVGPHDPVLDVLGRY